MTASPASASIPAANFSARPAAVHSRPLRSRWRTDRLTGLHLIAALGMAALGVLSTLDAWKDIYTIARNDEEYSHIFLVPIVAIWMIWVRRICRNR